MEAPNIRSIFFKSVRRKPRQFELKTRHFDQDKIDLEARKRAIERKVKRENNEELDEYIPSRSISFEKSKAYHRNQVQKAKRSATIRLIIILAALIFGFLYGMDHVDGFLARFIK